MWMQHVEEFFDYVYYILPPHVCTGHQKSSRVGWATLARPLGPQLATWSVMNIRNEGSTHNVCGCWSLSHCRAQMLCQWTGHLHTWNCPKLVRKVYMYNREYYNVRKRVIFLCWIWCSFSLAFVGVRSVCAVTVWVCNITVHHNTHSIQHTYTIWHYTAWIGACFSIV